MALARALVTGAPDAGDDKFWDALGVPNELRAGLAQSAVIEVWPENWAALELFSALQTQWRIGMAGPTGLDYAALPVVMDLQHIAAPDRPGLFESLRVMEAEALRVFAERQKQHGR